MIIIPDLEQKPLKDQEKIDKTKYTVDDNRILRFDLIFSYWLLLWFIIYYFYNSFFPKTSYIAIIIKKYFNPQLGLIIGLFENFLMFLFLIVYGVIFDIIMFFISVLLFKGLPIYLLRNDKIKWKNDFFMLLVFFLVYVFHLYINGTTVYNVYVKTAKSLIERKNQTPLYNLISEIKEYFTNK